MAGPKVLQVMATLDGGPEIEIGEISNYADLIGLRELRYEKDGTNYIVSDLAIVQVGAADPYVRVRWVSS